jgi:DNA-binding LytR/AlgR family response regulator
MQSSNIKILIVEDEAIIAERLFMDLQDYGYDVAEPCLSAEEAVQTLAATPVDLALLDINLKTNVTGIQLANLINEQYKIPFIFLTANTDDATIQQAALVKPQAFLSKPIQMKTLIGTIQVAIHNHQTKKLQTVIDASANFHFIKRGNTLHKIEWDSITHVSSENKYSLVFEKGSKVPYPIKISLELLAQQLAPYHFWRIHKSHLVNLSYVTALTNNTVNLNNAAELPVGDSYRAVLMQKLKIYQ